MNRAIKGGQVGINGEFYEGGKFLPNTQKPKGEIKRKGSGKQEIAPYVWEVAPEGMTSIYRNIIGILAKWVNGGFVVNVSPETLKFLGMTIEEAHNLVNRWNAGERWMPYKTQS